MAIVDLADLERWLGAKGPSATGRGGQQLTFVGELNYWDEDAAAADVAYFSWHGASAYRGVSDLVSPPSGYVISGKAAPARLVLPAFSLSILDDSPAPAGAGGEFVSSPRLASTDEPFGPAQVRVQNHDGKYDALLYRRSYAGHKFRLYLIGLYDLWQAYPNNGIIEALFRGEPTLDTASGEIIFELRASSVVDQAAPLHARQGLYYAGTGGTEGGVTLRGKEKPLVFGEVYGHVPAPLDSIGRDYQVDGSGLGVEAIPAVYEGGLALTLTTDYTVNLSIGRFTLVNAPTNEITCDVKGAKFDGGAYSANAGKIAEYILKTHGAAGTVTLGGYDTDFPQTAGLAIPWGEPTALGDALNEILAPRGAWFQRLGKTSIDVISIQSPHDQTPGEDYRDQDIEAVATQPVRRVASQVRVRYRRIKKPLAQFAGAVTATERLRQSIEWREEVWPPSPAVVNYLEAVPFVVDSPWVDAADALAEAKVQYDRWRVPRRRVVVDLARKPLHSELGDFASAIKKDGAGVVRYNLDPGGDLLKEDSSALLKEGSGEGLLTELSDTLVTELSESLVTEGSGAATEKILIEGGGALRFQVGEITADFENGDFSVEGIT